MTAVQPGQAGEFPTEFSATSLTGSISVRTNEMGLPLGIEVDADQLRRDPEVLAGEVLRLCKQAANRAGLARRAQLRQLGFTSEMLALTGLPTEQQVATQEIVDEQDYDTEPQSWLRSI
ncbi:hypothetical protein [Nocardia sp. NPDC057455]|uniref:hypothetical protein n=1 Tax=Nocardia sp. NPDC057455 TaxID=3346138 RepID=UPI0036709B0E